MFDFTERTALLLGSDAMEKLAQSRVAVFGLGGVGGYVTEALARSGVGVLDLTDCDTVSLSNLNRQILALRSTVGQYKADVAKQRILDINPACTVTARRTFVGPESISEYDFSAFDCVVDAVDNVTAKLLLAQKCTETGTPIISSMGTGNKLSPFAFSIADINSTSMCPLARVMRRELKKRGIPRLTVLYSTEEPRKPQNDVLPGQDVAKPVPGSSAFVPPCAGLMIASWVINRLLTPTSPF